MSALLVAEEVAGPAQLEIAHGDAEARPELVVLAHGGQALAGEVQHAGVAVQEQVGVGLALEAPHAPAQLVELR